MMPEVIQILQGEVKIVIDRSNEENGYVHCIKLEVNPPTEACTARFNSSYKKL